MDAWDPRHIVIVSEVMITMISGYYVTSLLLSVDAKISKRSRICFSVMHYFEIQQCVAGSVQVLEDE